MKILVESRPRLPVLPVWVSALVVLWLFLVACVQWLAYGLKDPPLLCHLRIFTGIPCPTCGTTRALLALFDGRPLDAFLLNPLMLLIIVGGSVIFALRLLSARQLLLVIRQEERPWIGLFVAAIFFANWAYVIAVHSA